MLRSIKNMHGFTISATDGNIGRVQEFYFDDQKWVIRYLVADTGTWLPERMVLLSPMTLKQPDWGAHILPVNLSRGQIENSPSIEADKPVSHQMEDDLHTYYGWAPYWTTESKVTAKAMPAGVKAREHGEAPYWTTESQITAQAMPAGVKEREYGEAPYWTTESEITAQATPTATEERIPEAANPHLRSSQEVIGYHIQAKDGEIGYVEDLIVEDEDWSIHQLVANVQDRVPGKQKVFIDSSRAMQVSWTERKVHLDMTRDMIAND